MKLRPVYSPEAQARIDAATRDGKRRPRVKPLYWELRGRLGGREGVQIKRHCASKEEANNLWTQIEHDWKAAKDRGIDPVELERSGRMTIRDFARCFYAPQYLENQTAPSHKRDAAALLDRVLLPLIGDLRLKDATPARIVKLAGELATTEFPVWAARDRRAVGAWYRGDGPMPQPIGYAPMSKSRQDYVFSIAVSLLKYAATLRYLPSNPADGLNLQSKKSKQPKRTKSNNHKMVDPWQIERVRMEMSPRDRAMVRVLYTEGDRPHEIVAWQWIDVRDPETHEMRREILIEHGISAGELWHTKTYRKRRITLFDPAREALQEWHEARTEQLGRPPEDDELVFPPLGPRTKHTYLDIQQWGTSTLAAACRRAGVPVFNQYRMRATCAALLAAGGVVQADGRVAPWTVREVADHLGHSAQTCETYYLGYFRDPGKYRGVPLEHVVRDAVFEAQSVRDAWVGELREMAETFTHAEIAERLNEGPMLAPRHKPWTQASVKALLRRVGVFDVVDAERRARNEQTFARIRELAAHHTPTEIAAILNEEGHTLLRRDEGTWTREYVEMMLKRLDLARFIANPRYDESVARAVELAGTAPHSEIAETLNREQLFRRNGEAWKEHNVGSLLLRNGTRSVGERNPGFEESCEFLRSLAAAEPGLNYPELVARINDTGHRGKFGAPWTVGMVGDVLRAAGVNRWAENDDYPASLERLTELVAANELTATQMGDLLNAEGHLTRHGLRWTQNVVLSAIKRERLRDDSQAA
jgi:integrase